MGATVISCEKTLRIKTKITKTVRKAVPHKMTEVNDLGQPTSSSSSPSSSSSTTLSHNRSLDDGYTVAIDTDKIEQYELNISYTVVELLVAVVACVGNALVITVFHRERRLRKRTNYYIVSLAMADFLVGLLGIPFAIMASIGLPTNLHACLFTVSLLVVLCTISIFCLVAVSIDRYWAILYPLAYSRNVTTKTAIVIISFCWALGIIIGFLPLAGWRSPTAANESCLFVKIMDYNYLLFLYFATIITPAMLLLAFYVHIYTVIMKQVRKTVTINPSSSSTNGSNKTPKIHLKCITKSQQGGTMLRVLGAARKREVKATQNLSIIVLFFMVCWLPLYTINCIMAFCPTCEIPPKVTLVFIVLSHLNSAVNPLMYAYHLKDFRAALQSIICNILGIKMQHTDINYRFSIHSQNRITTLFDRRNASLQPKKYIDSPVWLRQQAQNGLIQSPSLLRPSAQLQNDNRPPNEMWKILEVSAEDKLTYVTNLSTDRYETMTAQHDMAATDMVEPPMRDYTFNYDHLDNVVDHRSTVEAVTTIVTVAPNKNDCTQNDDKVVTISAAIATNDSSRFSAIITRGVQQKLMFVWSSATTASSLIALRTVSKSESHVNRVTAMSHNWHYANIRKSYSIDVLGRTDSSRQSQRGGNNKNRDECVVPNQKPMLAYQKNVSLSHSDISCMKSLS